MKWEKTPIESQQVRSLAETYNVDLLTAAILTRRGQTEPEQLAFFLEEDERFLHNPYLFPDMEKAVERVIAAAEEGEKVLICGDRDADGITATVLLTEALRAVGLEPRWRVPVGDEDYGLNARVLEEHAAEDVTLVISVDCGITDFAEIELAARLGMDVIILDHHVPRESGLPDAYAIINPKIPGSYPFAGLCAAAIVSKFQWALTLAGAHLQEYCLVLCRRNEDRMILEAVRMRNLLEAGRISVSEGDDLQRFVQFIEGLPLYTYGAERQIPMISEFFGGAEVHAADAAPELAKAFPSLRGMSIEDLEHSSRLARYFPENSGALTALRNLMVTHHYRSVSDSFDGWRRGLDLAALGTLADLMPLENENRILVRMGLKRLNGTDALKERRPALRELLIRQRLHERRVGTTEIAWQIAPLINATGRMKQADAGVRLFLETDPAGIASLADEVVELNRKRRSLGDKMWKKIEPEAYKVKDDLGGHMVIVADDEVPKGITGILATRLQRTMGTASVVIAVNGDSASGSIRCETGMNVLTWLEAMGPLLDDFGGHPQAGGFRLETGRIGELISRTRKWFTHAKEEPALNQKEKIDAELSHSEIIRLGPEGLEKLLESLEPYGEGFGPLTFLTRSVKVFEASLVGKPENNHLKLLVSLGSHRWPALWWDGASRYGTDIREDTDVDLVYRVDRDRWRDAQRLTILEAAPCE